MIAFFNNIMTINVNVCPKKCETGRMFFIIRGKATNIGL